MEKIDFKIVYWDDIIEEVDKAEIGNDNLNFFVNKIRPWFSYRQIRFNKFEILSMFIKIECDDHDNRFSNDEVNMAFLSPIPAVWKKSRCTCQKCCQSIKKRGV